ncbi:MAG: hypothetical protein R3C44_24440 [Chloroflexota bacterium]
MTVWARHLLPFLVWRWPTPGSAGGPRWLQIILGVALLVPALYTGYSVVHYFGIGRAASATTFRQSYREIPMATGRIWVQQRHTCSFLLLWAVLAGSRAALARHCSSTPICVHWYTVEQPDMPYLPIVRQALACVFGQAIR